jgi:glycosyltransferase involved in cell wall biosynthesis
MRIALISKVFAPEMGYLENVLPKYLARLGAQVDVVASPLPPSHHPGPVPRTGRDLESGLRPGAVEKMEGFRLHVLGYDQIFGQVHLHGLGRKLQELRPDVVQTMTPIGGIAIASAWNQLRLGYRLFSGCHYHASVFPLARSATPFFHPARVRCFLERSLHGRMVSWMTEKYYAISPDCAEVAIRFFGVPRHKLEICPLGVDTEIFYPASGAEERAERTALRGGLGFRGGEIVCVYSGRFGDDKNPLLLARAIARLASAGEPFRGLFVGEGPQAEAVAKCRGCVVVPFAPMSRLGGYYRAAEIGVWPTQESMSMLDSLACGLPLIANDTMHAPERLHGTGLAYRLGDVDDLERKIRSLGNAGVREKLGAEGARRMQEEFSWKTIAARRLEDYSTALSAKGARVRAPKWAQASLEKSEEASLRDLGS